jgi:hypothetical protein
VKEMQQVLQWWTKMRLRHTSTFGVRVYRRDSMLINHVDRMDTHLASAVLQVMTGAVVVIAVIVVTVVVLVVVVVIIDVVVVIIAVVVVSSMTSSTTVPTLTIRCTKKWTRMGVGLSKCCCPMAVRARCTSSLARWCCTKGHG